MRLYTARDISVRVGLSVSRIQAMAAQGRIGCKIGKSYVFNVRDLEKLSTRSPAGRPVKGERK